MAQRAAEFVDGCLTGDTNDGQHVLDTPRRTEQIGTDDVLYVEDQYANRTRKIAAAKS